MPKADHQLKTKKPVSVLFKPLKADFKDLFKALAKGIGHTATGKWAELAADTAMWFPMRKTMTTPRSC